MLLSIIQRLYALKNERGATAVEYGIMVALIAVVIITMVAAVGTQLNGVFTTVAEELGFVAPPP